MRERSRVFTSGKSLGVLSCDCYTTQLNWPSRLSLSLPAPPCFIMEKDINPGKVPSWDQVVSSQSRASTAFSKSRHHKYKLHGKRKILLGITLPRSTHHSSPSLAHLLYTMLPLNNITLQSHITLRLQQLDLLLPSAGPLSIPSSVDEGIQKVPVSVEIPPSTTFSSCIYPSLSGPAWYPLFHMRRQRRGCLGYPRPCMWLLPHSSHAGLTDRRLCKRHLGNDHG